MERSFQSFGKNMYAINHMLKKTLHKFLALMSKSV